MINRFGVGGIGIHISVGVLSPEPLTPVGEPEIRMPAEPLTPVGEPESHDFPEPLTPVGEPEVSGSVAVSPAEKIRSALKGKLDKETIEVLVASGFSLATLQKMSGESRLREIKNVGAGREKSITKALSSLNP